MALHHQIKKSSYFIFSNGASHKDPSNPSLSFPDNFHQDSFPAPSVKLTVEDLLPGPEIKPSLRYGHDDVPSHDFSFQVHVAVVFSGAIMLVP